MSKPAQRHGRQVRLRAPDENRLGLPFAGNTRLLTNRNLLFHHIRESAIMQATEATQRNITPYLIAPARHLEVIHVERRELVALRCCFRGVEFVGINQFSPRILPFVVRSDGSIRVRIPSVVPWQSAQRSHARSLPSLLLPRYRATSGRTTALQKLATP